jgi:hypothetical protein
VSRSSSGTDDERIHRPRGGTWPADAVALRHQASATSRATRPLPAPVGSSRPTPSASAKVLAAVDPFLTMEGQGGHRVPERSGSPMDAGHSGHDGTSRTLCRDPKGTQLSRVTRALGCVGPIVASRPLVVMVESGLTAPTGEFCSTSRQAAPLSPGPPPPACGAAPRGVRSSSACRVPCAARPSQSPESAPV